MPKLEYSTNHAWLFGGLCGILIHSLIVSSTVKGYSSDRRWHHRAQAKAEAKAHMIVMNEGGAARAFEQAQRCPTRSFFVIVSSSHRGV
jgi:hypothetical protein